MKNFKSPILLLKELPKEQTKHKVNKRKEITRSKQKKNQKQK